MQILQKQTCLNTVSTIYLYLITFTALAICCNRFSLSYISAISFSFYLTLFLVFVFLLGKIKLSLSITSTFIIIIQLLNQLKVHFYKERLFFSDTKIILDPINFGTLFHYPLALLSIMSLVIFLFLNFSIYLQSSKTTKSFRLCSIITAFGLMLGIVHLSQDKQNIENWQSSLPKGKGTIVNLFMSAQQAHYQPPQYNESSTYFTTQKQFTYEANKNANKPDIIVMLQESTVNPKLYKFPDIVIPNFKMFDDDEMTKAAGQLRVQTFGGGTWLSEFSFLTGLNSNDFTFRKNAVFYTVAPHIQNSLFHELKNHGYYTVVLTPMCKMNYNAGAAYDYFGVDQIIQPQELGYPASLEDNLWSIPTSEMLQYVKQLLNKYTDKPLFIFMLTMNEHGPYKQDYPDNIGIEKIINDKATAGAFNHYLSKLKLLDQATTEFTHFLLKREKPSLFLYFGDHQPNIGWENDYNTSLHKPRYLTQFYLKDNASQPRLKNVGDVTDISFLGGMILEQAGLAVSPFYEANIKMRNLCQGRLDDCDDKKLVESYKHYIYQEINTAGN